MDTYINQTRYNDKPTEKMHSIPFTAMHDCDFAELMIRDSECHDGISFESVSDLNHPVEVGRWEANHFVGSGQFYELNSIKTWMQKERGKDRHGQPLPPIDPMTGLALTWHQIDAVRWLNPPQQFHNTDYARDTDDELSMLRPIHANHPAYDKDREPPQQSLGIIDKGLKDFRQKMAQLNREAHANQWIRDYWRMHPYNRHDISTDVIEPYDGLRIAFVNAGRPAHFGTSTASPEVRNAFRLQMAQKLAGEDRSIALEYWNWHPINLNDVEKVADSYLDNMIPRIDSIENSRDFILSMWRPICSDHLAYVQDRQQPALKQSVFDKELKDFRQKMAHKNREAHALPWIHDYWRMHPYNVHDISTGVREPIDRLRSTILSSRTPTLFGTSTAHPTERNVFRLQMARMLAGEDRSIALEYWNCHPINLDDVQGVADTYLDDMIPKIDSIENSREFLDSMRRRVGIHHPAYFVNARPPVMDREVERQKRNNFRNMMAQMNREEGAQQWVHDYWEMHPYHWVDREMGLLEPYEGLIYKYLQFGRPENFFTCTARPVERNVFRLQMARMLAGKDREIALEYWNCHVINVDDVEGVADTYWHNINPTEAGGSLGRRRPRSGHLNDQAEHDRQIRGRSGPL